MFGGTVLPFVNRVEENTELYRTITTKVTEAAETTVQSTKL